MSVLPGTEHQPHARAVLARALARTAPDGGHVPGDPSHAYLFQGPPGSGKRTVARALATVLLAETADGTVLDPAGVASRVERRSHPDLTWVRPTGSGEMRVSDVKEAVVEAVANRPFEARRRVFVLERAHAMNDGAANRLLKTLEEPPDYVVLVLLSDRPGELLPTIRSRCQTVRFDALPEGELATRLRTTHGVDETTALACARLGLGDALLAGALAGGDGAPMRAAAEAVARHAIHAVGGQPPWKAMSDAAAERGKAAGTVVEQEAKELAERLPDRERRRIEREAKDDAKRAVRRERTAALDASLRLCGLWFRDAASVAVGAEATVHHVDRLAELREDAGRTDVHRLLRCVDVVDETRRTLRRNATEDLQLDAMSVRLAGALARR
ncbi:ATP-binding protein [Patulibacter minatonensis]|uniref:DNA polymerase III subunit n=1 Tax=Patulibacter minatonensis TaxID=298163 RepID=UPI00047C84C9|nr:AAA family ATPase [Patulibacter minatonensis]